MKGQRKRPKYIGRVTRRVVAEQLRTRMRARFGETKNQERRLAEAIGTTQSNIQRILSEQQGASVDMLEQIAKFFQIAPYELLLPPPDLRRMMEVQDPATSGPEPLLRQTDKSTEPKEPTKERRAAR